MTRHPQFPVTRPQATVHPFYTIAEVSELLQVSKAAVYHWIRQGRLWNVEVPAHKGLRRIILLEDLIDHLQEHHFETKEEVVLRMRRYRRTLTRMKQAKIIEKNLHIVNLKTRKNR